MRRESVDERVWSCLEKVVGTECLKPVDTNTDLFDNAILDSLAAVQMFEVVQKEFGIELEETVLFEPKFTTLAGIAQLVTGRTGSRST